MEVHDDRIIAVGLRRWKAYNLRPILAARCRSLHFVADTRAARRLTPREGDALAVWGATPSDGVTALAQETGAAVLRIEDGFIRSVGLGSDLIPPQSLVLDRRGIYFDATRPSDLEILLNTAAFDAADLEIAARMRGLIVDRGLTKYNIEPRRPPDWDPRGRRTVLVPGQVETDASIALGGTAIRSNLALLRAVRDACPDDYIVYKPHPDVMSRNRRGQLARQAAAHIADRIESECSITSCIDACDAVHTITSLAGFDALLRRKPVTTWGAPFYAGWGLTDDRSTGAPAFARRTRTLTLDQLAAGALLQYPVYWDKARRRISDCESVLSNIARERETLERTGRLDGLRDGLFKRQIRKLRTLGRAWFAA